MVKLKSKKDKVVIFFTPHDKVITGGILSIFSLAKESREILGGTTNTYLSVFPGQTTYIRNDLFENDEVVYEMEDIIKKHPSPRSLTIHFPEYAVDEFAASLEAYRDYLKPIPDFHINVLNQNIEIMPDPIAVAELFKFTTNVTQSTAHNRYSTQALCDLYGIPTHLMSTFVDRRQYTKTDFSKKDALILYSPDKHPQKKAVLGKIKEELPAYSLQEIRDLSYEDYKAAISRASFVITFGEGMDAYFLEPAYSGTLSFTVYNESFFPGKEFLELPNVYSSYSDMLESVARDIGKFKSEADYYKVTDRTADYLDRYYNFENYIRNLKKFWAKEYTFLPSLGSREALLGRVVAEKNGRLADLRERLAEEKATAETRELVIADKNRVISETTGSLSWRVTRPLRAVKQVYKALFSRP